MSLSQILFTNRNDTLENCRSDIKFSRSSSYPRTAQTRNQANIYAICQIPDKGQEVNNAGRIEMRLDFSISILYPGSVVLKFIMARTTEPANFRESCLMKACEPSEKSNL